MPGLESRSVVVEADADRAIICGAVSDRGGGVDGRTRSSRSSRTSSDEVGAGGRPIEEARESTRGAGRPGGLAVRRDVRLSGDEDSDSSAASTCPTS